MNKLNGSNLQLCIDGGISKSVEKTENYIMPVNLLTSHDLVKELQAKLIDYSALNDAPDRIEAVPSVFIEANPSRLSFATPVEELLYIPLIIQSGSRLFSSPLKPI